MKTTLTTIAAAIAFSTSASVFAEGLLKNTDLDGGANKRIRVVVPPTDAAIDGEPRPQLGRSLADSIIAGLIQSGRYQVTDSADLGLLSATTADSKLAETLIKQANADVFLVSRLVGEFDYFHFTVREIEAKSKEVVAVHELSHKGSRDEVYELIPKLLAKLGAPNTPATGAQRPPRNPLDRPAVLKEGGSTYYPLKGGNQGQPLTQPKPQLRSKVPAAPSINKKPPVLPLPTATPASPRTSVAETLPRALPASRVERVPVGTIQLVNVPWKFCVVKPYAGVDLELYDRLEILTGVEQFVYAKLYVTRFDSGRVIADYGNNKWNRVLDPGETVFGYQDVPLR